ncbi:four-domain proteases inhibitor-like [Macrobrachium nipponense]|uniref:four-domain proteases inhibitor-like n=1 Tax=Macrobrachium nipponense TaxID=159736 RepID=UPI0030C86048
MKLPLLYFFVVSAFARSEDCDFLCSEEWSPVCGTDTVTYASECWLALADCKIDDDIALDHMGECQPALRKSRPKCQESVRQENCDLHYYNPVCERSGVTYRSMCHLCQSMYKDQQTKNIMYIIEHLGPCTASAE